MTLRERLNEMVRKAEKGHDPACACETCELVRVDVPRLVRGLEYAVEALTWVRTERDRDEARDAVSRILAGEEE